MSEEDASNVVPFPGGRERAPDELKSAVEALLFASGVPVTVQELCVALEVLDGGPVRAALHELAQDFVGRGVQLVMVAGGWQLRTHPRHADEVLRLRGGTPTRMSRAALEALAIVAYRQPATRAEVEEIRGVASGGVLKTLLEKGYLKVVGRRDEPGRPLEYGTTPLFLEMFSLPGLGALPTLKEREDLGGSDEEG